MTDFNPITIPLHAEELVLRGHLYLPENPLGLVLFSHGSGSSHKSVRNNFVARELMKNDLAALLFDLLTEEEDRFYENRFNIELLSERLAEVTRWVLSRDEFLGLPLGYFGASTGAASALSASVGFKEIKAIVSRGGRPDLALDALPAVTAPTCLIVGGDDTVVIDLNRKAFNRLSCTKELRIIPGATHLFEEAGALENVARISSEWFSEFLTLKAYV